MQQLWTNGSACVAVAAFLFSIATLLVKLSSDDLSPFTICAVTSTAATLVILITAVSTRTSLIATTRRAQGLIALRACFGACTLLSYYAAVEVSGIRDSTALYFTSPLFTLVFECMVHARLPCRASMLGALATAAGALMVSERCLCSILGSRLLGEVLCMERRPSSAVEITLGKSGWAPRPPQPLAPQAPAHPWQRSFIESIGLFAADPPPEPPDLLSLPPSAPALSADTLSLMGTSLALSAAATNALSFITVRALGKGTPTLTLTFWHQAIIAGVASISQMWLFLVESRRDDWDDEGTELHGPSSWGSVSLLPGGRDALLLLGIFLALLGAQLLQNRGLAITSPSRGAAINVLQVVFCFLWDLTVLGHALNMSSTAGGILIMAGVLVLTSRLPSDAAPEPLKLKAGDKHSGSSSAKEKLEAKDKAKERAEAKEKLLGKVEIKVDYTDYSTSKLS